jgi:GMP synthase (glutamine-hydrolysing)
VLRFAERAWGVQFHPEFDAEIMASYLSLTGEQLSKYGFDPAALRQGLRTTPVAQTLLQRFSNLMAGSTSLRSNYLSVL